MSVASPCVNICTMDAERAICVGCFRTLDEIAQWSRADDDRKLAILAAVDRRGVVFLGLHQSPRELRRFVGVVAAFAHQSG